MTRLVVVAPHPDDEVLIAGCLMRRHAANGGDVMIIAVTDGEASHAGSDRITPVDLRTRRNAERGEALARLGVSAATVHRLGLPDQGCYNRVDALAAAVEGLADRSDLVVTVSAADRHPDHVATALAMRRVSRALGASVLEAPTWALVHGCAPAPTTVHRLGADELRAKRHALAAYRSQLEPLGPSPLDGPVVHPRELALMVRPIESFVAVGP